MIHQHLTYVPPTVIRRVLCKLADVWKWFRRHELVSTKNHHGTHKDSWSFIDILLGNLSLDGPQSEVMVFQLELGHSFQSTSKSQRSTLGFSASPQRHDYNCWGTDQEDVADCVLVRHAGYTITASRWFSTVRSYFCLGTLSPGVKDLWNGIPYWGSDLHHMKFNYVQVVSSHWSIWFGRIKDLLSNLGEFRSAWAVFIFSFSSDSNSEDKNQNWYCTVDEHDIGKWLYLHLYSSH